MKWAVFNNAALSQGPRNSLEGNRNWKSLAIFLIPIVTQSLGKQIWKFPNWGEYGAKTCNMHRVKGFKKNYPSITTAFCVSQVGIDWFYQFVSPNNFQMVLIMVKVSDTWLVLFILQSSFTSVSFPTHNGACEEVGEGLLVPFSRWGNWVLGRGSELHKANV